MNTAAYDIRLESLNPVGPRFIVAVVLGTSTQGSAVAVLDHDGDLTLAAPLPDQLRHQLLDREGLLAHLIQWVPSLPAITDVFVSWVISPADIKLSDSDLKSPTADASPDLNTGPPSSLLLQTIEWLGPLPHAVAPAAWQGHSTAHLSPQQDPESFVEDLQPDFASSLRHSHEVERAAVRLGLYGLTQLRQLKTI